MLCVYYSDMWRLCVVLLVAAHAQACELKPREPASPKSPGDNFYRLIVNGEVERYAPGERYVGRYILDFYSF